MATNQNAIKDEKRAKLLQNITEALQSFNAEALELIDDLFIKTMKSSTKHSVAPADERPNEHPGAAGSEAVEQSSKQTSVMRMLSNSRYYSCCAPGGKYHCYFDEVIGASAAPVPLDAAIDIFSIGMICGIKEQRAKNKRAKERAEK